MIDYQVGFWQAGIIFKLKGSVFPNALFWAIPCALLSGILKGLQTRNQLGFFSDWMEPLTNSAAFSGFSFLVGFIIVFRTGQSYNRFMVALSSTHQMIGKFLDAASSLTAFGLTAKDSDHDKTVFLHTMIRLVSLLSASALEDLTRDQGGLLHLVEEGGTTRELGLEVLDLTGLDVDTISALDEANKRHTHNNSKVVMIYQWIQQVVLEHLEKGMMPVPPPILSRSFTELAGGISKFHDAFMYTTVPFPFPYTQTTVTLLLFHWILTPIVMLQWTDYPLAASGFTFIQVFILWSLNAIATGIERPFGGQPNDINPYAMQRKMNLELLLLLNPASSKLPTLANETSLEYKELEKKLAADRKQGRADFALWETQARWFHRFWPIGKKRPSAVAAVVPVARVCSTGVIRSDDSTGRLVPSVSSRSQCTTPGSEVSQSSCSKRIDDGDGCFPASDTPTAASTAANATPVERVPESAGSRSRAEDITVGAVPDAVNGGLKTMVSSSNMPVLNCNDVTSQISSNAGELEARLNDIATVSLSDCKVAVGASSSSPASYSAAIAQDAQELAKESRETDVIELATCADDLVERGQAGEPSKCVPDTRFDTQAQSETEVIVWPITRESTPAAVMTRAIKDDVVADALQIDASTAVLCHFAINEPLVPDASGHAAVPATVVASDLQLDGEAQVDTEAAADGFALPGSVSADLHTGEYSGAEHEGPGENVLRPAESSEPATRVVPGAGRLPSICEHEPLELIETAEGDEIADGDEMAENEVDAVVLERFETVLERSKSIETSDSDVLFGDGDALPF